MSSQILIKNIWLCKINEREINPIFCDLIIDKDTITSIVKKDWNKFLAAEKYSSEISSEIDIYDGGGKVATVPMINFHDHIYSRLAKGLKVKNDMPTFHSILKELWWKLDTVLDEDMIRASALMAGIESIRNGVTYIFDHHSSQSKIKSSLKIIAEELSKFGLYGTICFETTDRNGTESSNLAIEENLEFIHSGWKNFKGMFGIHASFTVSDKTLENISRHLKNYETGIHIHLCEDEVDRKISKKSFDASPIQRLVDFNLLNSKSILAHGIYVKRKEFDIISEYGASIALNPDSNLNNAVGIPAFHKINPDIPILSGTDGMHANVAKTYKQIFLLARHSGLNFNDAFSFVKKVYFNGIDFVQKYFPDFTKLDENQKANLVIWDYSPTNYLDRENFWGHFIYGLTERYPISVIQDGKFLMKDNKLLFDEQNILREIIIQGRRLKEAFENL